MRWKKPKKDFSEERVSELEALVDQQKKRINECKELIKGARIELSENSSSLLKYLCENEINLDKSYLFLDNRGKIIFYTPVLSRIMSLEENLEGTNYHTIFEPSQREKAKSSLGNYILGRETYPVVYETIIKGKKKIFLIHKKPPYTIQMKDAFEKETFIRVVVPVSIEPYSVFKRNKYKKIRETDIESATIKKIDARLIHQGWTAERILDSQKHREIDSVEEFLIKEKGWTKKKVKNFLAEHGKDALINEMLSD